MSWSLLRRFLPLIAVALILFLGAGLAFGATTVLPVFGGGTGWGNFVSGTIPFGNGASALSTSSSLTFSSSGTTLLTVANASTTALSATVFCLTGDICRTTWPSGGGGGGGYPFTNPTNYATTTYATSTPQQDFEGIFASSTSHFVFADFTQATTSTFYNTGITSALGSFDANHKLGAYTGTSCTNQFIRSLNGAGVATCATVANTDLANSSITITSQGELTGGASVSLGSSVTLNASTSPTVGYVTATSTTASSTFAGNIGIASTSPTVAVSLGAGGAITTTEASSTFASTVYDDWFTAQQRKYELGEGGSMKFRL